MVGGASFQTRVSIPAISTFSISNNCPGAVICAVASANESEWLDSGIGTSQERRSVLAKLFDGFTNVIECSMCSLFCGSGLHDGNIPASSKFFERRDIDTPVVEKVLYLGHLCGQETAIRPNGVTRQGNRARVSNVLGQERQGGRLRVSSSQRRSGDLRKEA